MVGTNFSLYVTGWLDYQIGNQVLGIGMHVPHGAKTDADP
jgi:hypothetical protein